MVMQEYTVTDEQAEDLARLAIWAFWFGTLAGFLGCIFLSNLLGWYS